MCRRLRSYSQVFVSFHTWYRVKEHTGFGDIVLKKWDGLRGEQQQARRQLSKNDSIDYNNNYNNNNTLLVWLGNQPRLVFSQSTSSLRGKIFQFQGYKYLSGVFLAPHDRNPHARARPKAPWYEEGGRAAGGSQRATCARFYARKQKLEKNRPQLERACIGIITKPCCVCSLPNGKGALKHKSSALN